MALVRCGRPVDTPRLSTVDGHRFRRCTGTRKKPAIASCVPQFVHMPIFVGRGWPAGVVRFRAGPPCRPVPRPLLPRRTGDLTPFPPGVD